MPFPSSPGYRTRSALLAAASALLALVAAPAPAAEIRFTVEAGDWCLSFDDAEVEFASDDPLSRRVGVPFFVAPWDTHTADLTDDPDRRGLFLRVWKRDPGRAQNLRDRRSDPRPGMCLEVPQHHGLSRLTYNPDLEDRARTGTFARSVPTASAWCRLRRPALGPR